MMVCTSAVQSWIDEWDGMGWDWLVDWWFRICPESHLRLWVMYPPVCNLNQDHWVMVISSDNYNILHIFIDHSAAMMIRINYIIYKYICIAISQCPRQPSATPEHFSLFPMPMFCRCSMTSPKIQHFMDGSSQADSDAGTPSGKLT